MESGFEIDLGMTPSRHRRHIIGMPGRIFVAPHHSTEELERRYKAADDGIERGHLQIIRLLSQGRSAKFVAEVTGYTPTWVSKILWRYNDHGLAGLGDGRLDNPGAAPLLEPAQVEELRDLVSKPPPDGGLWTSHTSPMPLAWAPPQSQSLLVWSHTAGWPVAVQSCGSWDAVSMLKALPPDRSSPAPAL